MIITAIDSLSAAIGADFYHAYRFDYDISDCTFRSMIRSNAGELIGEINCSVNGDMLIMTIAAGTLSTYIPGVHLYDVIKTSASGKMDRVISGKFTIEKAQTHD